MNTTPKITLLTLIMTITNLGFASTNAHGIADGTQLTQNLRLSTDITPQQATPYQLSDRELSTLANHILWQRLLLFKQGKSHVEQDEFFLAKDGSTNAKSELIATLSAMQKQDKTALCRFPARVHFLTEQLQKLGINAPKNNVSCGEFQAWFDKLDGQKLSLIFADEHPNVLASAFSHVFLRLDNQKSLISHQNKDAVAINYSSVHQEPSPNAAILAIKSTFGGFAGGIEFLNFEQKQDEYLIENERDIWQYSLDLTPEQVQQILRHIWETKDIARPYFFTHNNCATEIIRLIDVVRADKHLGEDVGSIVVPAKIARILNERSMINNEQFIASAATKRQAQLNSPHTFDIHAIKPNVNNPLNATPTHRLGLSVGMDDHHQQKTTYGLSLRSAYHDLLDSPIGVRKFLDVKLLSLDVRYDDEKLKIQDATIFATRSYNPSNSAKNNPDPTGKGKKAWGFDVGFRQAIDASSTANADHLVLNARYEQGKSWVFGTPKLGTGDLPDTLCYVLGGLNGQFGRINQGYRIGVGVNTGCVSYILDNVRMMGELQLPVWSHHDTAINRSSYLQPAAYASLQYDISRHQAIRLTAQLEKGYQTTQKHAQLQYLHYF